MGLTRREYEEIAAAIHKEYTPYMKEHHKYAIESVAVGLADTFAAKDPHFDRTGFLSVCGL